MKPYPARSCLRMHSQNSLPHRRYWSRRIAILQQEVARLGSELSERNAALTRSLNENDRMRAALQQMLDSLPCGVLVLNQADRIVMINPEGRRLLELKSAHIESLQALSAFCQIDFVVDGEKVYRRHRYRAETPMEGSAIAGWRSVAGNWILRAAPNAVQGLRTVCKVSGFSATSQQISLRSRSAKRRGALRFWRRSQSSWPTKLRIH